MAITEIPTTSTFGGVKESLRALAASVKRLAPSDWNALVASVIALYTAVGKDDGSTPGSLRAAIAAIGGGGAATTALTAKAYSTQTFASGVSPSVPMTFDTTSQPAGGADVPTLASGGGGIQVHRTGLYRIIAKCSFGPLAAGAGNLGLILVANDLSNVNNLTDAHVVTNPGTGEVMVRCVVERALTAGDVVRVYGYNTTGVDQSTSIGTAPYNQHVVPTLQISEV